LKRKKDGNKLGKRRALALDKATPPATPPTIPAFDGFSNVMKGIGGLKDSLTNTSFYRFHLNLNHNPALADDLYSENWLVGKIADIPASEITRKWRNIVSSETKERLDLFLKAQKELDVKEHFKEAITWADLFGGSAIHMIVNDGQSQDKPLKKHNIKKGSLRLRVFDPRHIFPVNYGLGEPELFRVQGLGETLTIHKSRLLIFKGLKATEHKKREYNFWGGSKVQRSIEPIIKSDKTIHAIINMLDEANVNVYKLEELTEQAINGEDEAIISRLKIVDQMKSYLNAVVLDAKDDFLKKSNDFKDLHNIDVSAQIHVAGSADIPATRLWGRSPDGMNATGASDTRNFNDRISAEQTSLEPKLNTLDEIIAFSTFGNPFECGTEWLSLEQETLAETTDRKKTQAETDAIYITNEVFSKDEIREATIRDDKRFSFLEARDKEKGAESA